jgi:voltage-dependent anion channel protein 2
LANLSLVSLLDEYANLTWALRPDFFKEQFDYSKQLKLKSTTANGVVLESSLKDGVEGGVKATYKQSDVGTFQVDLSTAGSAKYSFKAEKLAKGLTAKLSGDETPSGKVEIDYAQEMVSTSVVSDVSANSVVLDGAVTAGLDGFSAGGHVKYDVSAQQTRDFNVGAEYSSSDYTVTIKTSDSISKFAAGYFHNYSSDMQIGVQVQYDLRSSSNVITVGGSCKLDAASAVKLKVDSHGLLAAVLEHRLAGPSVKILLAAETNAKASTAPERFGVTLLLGDK